MKTRHITASAISALLVGWTSSAAAQSDMPTTMNFYGTPGVIDMPGATMRPDGDVSVTVSHFAGMTRSTLSFQITPRMSGSFRYIGLQDWDFGGFETYFDRSFDISYQLFTEGRIRPALTLGLRDFVGTGIYASEYIVASKSFGDDVRVTAGIGWGRLGSYGSIGAPFSETREGFDGGTDRGGRLSYDSWFRGDAAPFGGVEWRVNDKVTLKAEYSSDNYDTEAGARGIFDRSSPFNFGVEYKAYDALTIGAYSLYGSEFGIMAHVGLNPRKPATPFRAPPPDPVLPRVDPQENPDAWTTGWAENIEGSAPVIRDALEPVLRKSGLRLVSLDLQATRVELRYRNQRYFAEANAIGRAARALAQILPPSVETFDLVPVQGDIAVARYTLQRSDLERLETHPDAANALLTVTSIGEPKAAPGPDAIESATPRPRFSWAVEPYILPTYFDPDAPVRADAGIRARASYRFAPGLTGYASVRKKLVGNRGDSRRLSNSVLPRVRTDVILYAREGDPALERLYLDYRARLGGSLYGRVAAGYFEEMFGGVAAELLWKPVNSRLGFGAEIAHVMQRDYDVRFTFQDYDITTGHLSAYYDFGNGFHGQLDAGRYLAGDLGSTLTLTREFSNGWRLGAFATFTDVSFDDFGEGSFDKGIILSVPVNWMLGRPNKSSYGTIIRPIQRDGGARLALPNRLYGSVRRAHRQDVVETWGRVWN